MTDIISEAKQTCPSCNGRLTNGVTKQDGVEINIKHCEGCYWCE